MLLLLFKLALVGASVLLASLAARRFGHAVGGTIAGMPVIAGPIMGFVLWQSTPQQARAIALATLVCLPAAMVHMATFAWSATRWRWPVALLAANVAFLVAGAALSWIGKPAPVVLLLALAAPALVGLVMPRVSGAVAAVHIPRVELALRVLAAVLMAFAIIRSAALVPAMLSGLMLALPIAGNVLPCFTLPRYGAAATVALIAGFTRGVYGFACFFVTLYGALALLPAGPAYLLAWLAAGAAALVVYTMAQRARRKQSARLASSA